MVLNKLKEFLEKEQFDCTLISATEEYPFDRLLVSLNFDTKKREQLLEIIAHQQPLSPDFILPQGATLPHRVQFKVQLPFKVEDIALNQVSSLILFLNQFIDLPGFELNELEGRVSYRYVWIMQPDFLQDFILMSIIGAILLNTSLFSETIESIADGKKTFNDILAQIINMANNPNS